MSSMQQVMTVMSTFVTNTEEKVPLAAAGPANGINE